MSMPVSNGNGKQSANKVQMPQQIKNHAHHGMPHGISVVVVVVASVCDADVVAIVVVSDCDAAVVVVVVARACAMNTKSTARTNFEDAILPTAAPNLATAGTTTPANARNAQSLPRT
eukprot:1308476-Amphidinium_carterae.1